MEYRFKSARKSKGLTLKQVGDILGISESAVSNIERGRNKPSGSTLVLFCEKLGINQRWLETGEGEMFSESRSVTLDKIAKRYNGSETFRAMLDVYARLTSDQQNAFETYVSMLTQAIASGESPESVKPPETSLNARLGSRSEIPEADQDQRRAE